MEKAKALRIFNLTPPFSENAVKMRYKELIQKYHPDRLQSHDKWCHNRMTEIAQAQDELMKYAGSVSFNLWDNNYQIMEEPSFENQPVESPDTSNSNSGGFNSRQILSRIKDIMETYYHYGLENSQLRMEGVRRFRYREVRKKIENLEKELQIYRDQRQISSIFYYFCHYFKDYLDQPIPKQDLQGAPHIRRAFYALRDSSITCEVSMRDFFLDYSIPEGNQLNKLYAALQVVIVLSHTYPHISWSAQAKAFIKLFESFLEIVKLYT